MFNTILIANRGEIACRIMETAQSMGIACVAVHSDVDAKAKHVQMADRAVSLGGQAPADSYLQGEAIIAAALATGAQAIHPGYGFLSENPDFVEQVEAAGLTFIGPSASAIRAMGLKDAAKALMEEAGVPVVPGYHGADQDDATLSKAADEIGYPVLIKAVAGGGGKGMRQVEDPKDFPDALASARAEAKTAFGNDAVLVEKFVSQPRHIEVQVFGDGTSAVHLFERDCSLQRRHQKVIEEAPAPGMTEEMRRAMGAAAVRAATAISYKGAGTVEFIVDGSDGLSPDGFYFMEMNTRLQVEHPVTEAITGVDLVEWQLRVASGEPLPKTQEQLSITGHAFEARLYAEDAANGFLPVTGTLTHLRFPPATRSDSGVRAGDTISPWYDPMIAKVIVHGPTRAVALNKLSAALKDTEVAGTVTNLSFLGALASHPGFVAGEVDTGLIGRDLDALLHREAPGAREAVAAAQCALNLDTPGPLTGFALWHTMPARVALRLGEAVLTATVTPRGETTQRWTIDDGAAETVVHLTRSAQVWMAEGARLPAAVRAADTVTVMSDYGIAFDIIDPLAVASDGARDASVIEAPMPGLVRAVFAKPGQAVAKGDRLALMEAMKMEHTLTAARDGVVAEVLVSDGDQVDAGAALVRLEGEE
ncbi:MAG: biotin carboxylase N-terminal domain-containing protein [Pseudomonadota bacterium]